MGRSEDTARTRCRCQLDGQYGHDDPTLVSAMPSPHDRHRRNADSRCFLVISNVDSSAVIDISDASISEVIEPNICLLIRDNLETKDEMKEQPFR